MTKVAPIDQRKSDHIKINLEQDVRSGLTSGLENFRFIHEALPELDLNDVDTSLNLFGKITGCSHPDQFHDWRHIRRRDHQPASR